MPTAEHIDQTIQKHLPALRKPGVLTVRPGYEIKGHQLSGKQAVVATVHTKKPTSQLKRGDALPDSIGGVPVDVREATPHQRLRAHDPAAAALAQTYGRPEDKEPEWPYERAMPSGQPIASPASGAQKALAGATAPATARASATHASKTQIGYVPAPPPASLAPVTTTTTITAHVSPDAGLATLEAFLGGTTKSLVVGMYDFTSGSILRAFEAALDGNKTLRMVLDNPAPNPTRDQTDTQTVEALDGALGTRANIVRALERSDALVSAWIFPSAYHIKVIVRDGTAFWLSSGNLNNSNQPNFASPPQTEDRDWHVVIEDPGLAQTFAAFIGQDYASAQGHQLSAPSNISNADSRAVSDAHAKLAAEANPPPVARAPGAPAGAVAPKVFRNETLTITPLLTPDTLAGQPGQGQYLGEILKLVGTAKQKLYIQLQYIESSTGQGPYQALLEAIGARVAAGVDVRLIESQQYGEKWAEKMKSAGVDLTANIRLQPNVHNKGFVVDSSVAVVSSQNFSPQGIEYNRDAGVILASKSIAQYFEAVFLSDWTTKAKPVAIRAPGKIGTKKRPKKTAAATRASTKKKTAKRAKR